MIRPIVVGLIICFNTWAVADEIVIGPLGCEGLSKPSLQGEQPWSPTAEQLSAWISEAIEAEKKSDTDSGQIHPPSLRKISRWEYLKNEVFYRVFDALKAKKLRNSNAEKKSGLLHEIAGTIDKVNNSPFAFLVQGSAFNRLRIMLNSDALRSSSGTVEATRFVEFHKSYLEDIESDRVTYGKEFFDKETVAQGAINSFAIKLFAFLNGGTVADRLAANSISLLHPVVDAAMDKGLMTQETFKKLQRFLFEGVQPEIDSAYEKLLFGYLSRFESTFPRAQVPGFWFALGHLFKAQIQSLQQKKQRLSYDDHYRIALNKGGLSTVLAAYTALGSLTQKQFEFFYRTGGVFQLIDDLLDIDKDVAEGVETAWIKSKIEDSSYAKPMGHLLFFENYLENELSSMTSGFANPSAFSQVYLFAFKLSIMRALGRQQEKLDPRTMALFRNRMSISLRTLKGFMSSGGSTAANQEGSEFWLIQQLVEMTEAY